MKSDYGYISQIRAKDTLCQNEEKTQRKMRIRDHFLFADKGTEDRTHGKDFDLIYDFEEQHQSVIVLGF